MNNQCDQGVVMFARVTNKGSNAHPEYEHGEISQRDGERMSDCQVFKFLASVHLFILFFCGNRVGSDTCAE